MSVLWPPVCEITSASMEIGLGKWLHMWCVLFLLCCGKLHSYQSTLWACGLLSRIAGSVAQSRSVCVVVGCELFRQMVPAWSSWTQLCWLGSAVQQAESVHQHSHVSCFWGACDLHMREHCAGLLQLDLDSHSSLQQWVRRWKHIQPDPEALVSIKGEEYGWEKLNPTTDFHCSSWENAAPMETAELLTNTWHRLAYFYFCK